MQKGISTYFWQSSQAYVAQLFWPRMKQLKIFSGQMIWRWYMKFNRLWVLVNLWSGTSLNQSGEFHFLAYSLTSSFISYLPHHPIMSCTLFKRTLRFDLSTFCNKLGDHNAFVDLMTMSIISIAWHCYSGKHNKLDSKSLSLTMDTNLPDVSLDTPTSLYSLSNYSDQFTLAVSLIIPPYHMT